ncbi:MAG: hypothetical protein IJS97_03530 [Prevotella sp.]|nr:hypothetical protein [Prevotella sp.]
MPWALSSKPLQGSFTNNIPLIQLIIKQKSNKNQQFMKKITTILTFLMLVCMGAWADVTVTLVDGGNTNTPYDTYGTRSTATTPYTFTTNATSGLAGLILSSPKIDRGTYWNQKCLTLQPSTVQTDEEITLTAPSGYVIVAMSMQVQALSSSNPFKMTVAGDTQNSISGGSAYTFSPSGLYTKSLKMTFQQTSGTMNWLAVKSMTVTLRPIIARAGSRVELSSITAGTRYMIFDTHHSGSYNESEPRSGFVGAYGSTVTKDLNTAPLSHTDINGYQQWTLENTETAGQYYLYSLYAGQYYAAPKTFSATASQAIEFSQYTGSSQSLKDDGTFNTSPSSDNHIVQIENIDQTGNSQYWNGNKGSFATWASAHPYTVYTVTIPDAAYNLSDISTTKKYNIANPRGWWAVGADATDVNSTAELSLAQAWNDTKQQFAFIQHDGYYYLYSISEEKFAYVNGTKLSLSADVTDAVLASPVTYTASAYTATKGTYPFILTIGGKHFGVHPSVSPDAYQYTSTNDEGNGSLLIEAGNFDPTDVEALFNNVVTLTYKVVYDDAVLTGVEAEVESIEGEDLAIPSSLNRNGCTFTFYSDEECTSEITEVDGDVTTIYAKCTYSLSSLISADVEHLSWYRLAASSNSKFYDLYYNGSAPYPYKDQSAFDGSDGYFWAFVGNPFDGFKVYNKAVATTSTMIHNNNTNPLMATDDGTRWYITISNGMIGFQYTGNTGHRWNDHGGGAASLKYYGNESWHQYTNINDVDYSGLVENNIQPYVDNYGNDYFQITESYATALAGDISTANSDETISLSEYQELSSKLAGFIKWPTSGYYRIKSVSAETYLKATNADQLNVGGTNSEVSTIVYLSGSSGTYTMQMQGKYIGIQANSAATHLVSGSTTNYFTVPTSDGVPQPGQVVIGGGATATDYMRVNSTDVVGVAMGGNPNGNSACYWTVEPATDATVSLTAIGDNTYATTYLPFDVTVSGSDVTANAIVTSDVHAGFVVPTALADNKIPAGTPVILKGNSTSATSATLTINTGDAFSAISGTSALEGVYVNTAFALDATDGEENDCTADYFLGMLDGTLGFYHSAIETPASSGNYTLSANRAYLPASALPGAASRGFAIKWSDDVTSVRNAEFIVNSPKNGAFYDLSGRRVQNPQHGLYIVNGKMVVIK